MGRHPDFAKQLLLLFPAPKKGGKEGFVCRFICVCVYKKFTAEFDLLLKFTFKRKSL